jgi:serine protease Do
VAMGVASVPNRGLRETGGYMGIGLNQTNDGVEISEAVADGPAAKAGLHKGDLILAVNDKLFREATDLSQQIRTFKSGDKVQVKYRRGTEEKMADVTLGDRAKLVKRDAHSAALAIGTDVSEVRSGYPVVFQHDQPLKPQECGGVVLNLHGEVVGINIARAGRVDTYAIPAKTVAELLKTVNFGALEIQAADRREDSDSI